MIAGHLEEKSGKYYCVLSYKGADGKRERKWIKTGLPVKGNKKKAEHILSELRRNFKLPTSVGSFNSTMPFVDYLSLWIEIKKKEIDNYTYHNYLNILNTRIIPFFSQQKLDLDKVKRKDIQAFVDYLQMKFDLRGSTIRTYYQVLHLALKYAVRLELISKSPCEFIDLPSGKDQEQMMNKNKFYSIDELNKLFEIVGGTFYEVPVILAAFLGLRRGEVLGLKWSAIDFDKKAITINHAIKLEFHEGKRPTIKGVDSLKTRSSVRVLPLIKSLEDVFIKIQEEQEKNKLICGNAYNQDYLEYICVDKMGNIIKPASLTNGFRYHIKKNNLPDLNFHGLRHSCASLLLNKGYDLKTIQDFLGHSNYSITANIYAHVDKSKIVMAGDTINDSLIIPEKFDDSSQNWK